MATPEAPPVVESAAPSTSNDDVFADVVASTDTVADTGVATQASDGFTDGDAAVDVPDKALPDTPDPPASITMADVTAALEAQAASFRKQLDQRLQSTPEPSADAKPEPVATLPPDDVSVFVLAARTQIGEDAEHAPADLVQDRAELLDKQAGWVRWQKANPDDGDGQVRAKASISALARSLNANRRDIQRSAHTARQDATIAELQEQVEANRDRPTRKTPEVLATEYHAGIGEHVIAQAEKFPALAKAFAAGTIKSSDITESIDFGGDEKSIVSGILAGLPVWERALARVASLQDAVPATAEPDESRPLANPGILAPGSAHGAAGSQAYPTSNAEVFASITKTSNLPN